MFVVPNTKYISSVRKKNIGFSKDKIVTLFGFSNYGNEEVIPALPGTKEEIMNKIKCFLER